MEAEKGAAALEKGKGVVAGGRIITLKSSDGELRLVSEAAASLSGVISRAITDGCDNDTVVDLPNVAASALDKVLEYCNKHADPGDADATRSDCDPTASTVAGSSSSSSSSSSVNAAASEDLEVWDREFVDTLSLDALYDLLLAANNLEIEGLLDALCQKVADMIKGKSPAEIRSTFNLKYDFNEEEKRELLQENAWAFDYE